MKPIEGRTALSTVFLNQFTLKSRQPDFSIASTVCVVTCRVSSTRLSEKQIHRIMAGGTSKRGLGCAGALVVSEFSHLLFDFLHLQSPTFFQIRPPHHSSMPSSPLFLHPAYLWSPNWSFRQSVSLSLHLTWNTHFSLFILSLSIPFEAALDVSFIHLPPSLLLLIHLIFTLPSAIVPVVSSFIGLLSPSSVPWIDNNAAARL